MEVIAITGCQGFIGRPMMKKFKKNYIVYGISKKRKAKNVIKADVRIKKDLKCLLSIKPSIIIHLAAIKDVEFCEKNKKKVYSTNVIGTRNIINIAKKLNAYLIFVSSDYVFDGKKGNYSEKDRYNSINIYGKTKIQSEKEIKTKLKNYCIIRTAAIYSNVRKNFFNFVRNRFKRKEELSLYINQYFSPTSINSFCKTVERVCKLKPKGIFHIVDNGKISRYKFGLKIAKYLKLDINLISQAKLKNPIRPLNTSLNIKSSEKRLKMRFSTINKSLREVVNEIKKS